MRLGNRNTYYGQRDITATDHFEIKGAIKKSLVVNLRDLEDFPIVMIDSILISNYLRKQLHLVKHIKAVLLRKILDKVEIIANPPKELSEYYLKFIASDG